MSRPEGSLPDIPQLPMSGYGQVQPQGGFMSGLMSILGPHIEQNRQIALNNKKTLAQPYWDAAMASAQRGYDLHHQYTDAAAKGASQDQLDSIESQIEAEQNNHETYMQQYAKNIPGGNDSDVKNAIANVGKIFHLGKAARKGGSILPPPQAASQIMSSPAPGASDASSPASALATPAAPDPSAGQWKVIQ